MFMRENVNRKGFTNAGGGDQREPAASWEGPKSVLDLQAALGNMADVFAALWPLDPTPRVLHRHGCGPKRVITNQKLVFLYIYKFDSFSFLLFFLVFFYCFVPGLYILFMELNTGRIRARIR
jgi:hypothetical protein